MNKFHGRKSVTVALEAVSSDPETFASFMRNLKPHDLEGAWELAGFLSSIDDPHVQHCFALLASWCLRNTLNPILRDRDNLA